MRQRSALIGCVLARSLLHPKALLGSRLMCCSKGIWTACGVKDVQLPEKYEENFNVSSEGPSTGS